MPPAQAGDLEPPQPSYVPLPIPPSRTNSNQYYASTQLYPTPSFQRGVSSFQPNSTSQPQTTLAGQPTAASISTNTVDIINNSHSSPEHRKRTLSTSHTPSQAPITNLVAPQLSFNAHTAKLHPATLLQSDLGIQPQVSQQSNSISQPNYARTVEVRLKLT